MKSHTLLVTVTTSLFALFLTASGCSQSPADAPFAITFDPCRPISLLARSAKPQEVASIGDAAAMWRARGITPFTVDVIPGAQEIPVAFESAAPVFYGLYEDKVGDIVINHSVLDRHARAVTIAHELGHALGLHHISENVRSSVMNPGNLTVEPTAADAAAVTALWGTCSAQTVDGGAAAAP